MGCSLVVPVQVDALCLARDLDVTEPTADFTRLPYVDPVTGGDRQADQPYLSEIVLSRPFQDQGFRLKAGIHLHWTLPDALTRMEQHDGRTDIPVAPNRWLVTRSRDGTIEDQWMVESDFIADANAAAYPVIADQMPAPAHRPFHYLGRKIPLKLWKRTADRTRYLTALTAVGYGEPTFAAFYPNCHSVFGFHDPAYAGPPPPGLRYDVMGWYDDIRQDAMTQVLAVRRDGEAWEEALQHGLAWTVAPESSPPERMICFARLTFAPAETTANPLLTADGETGVCVGNTATEALAAHLGATLHGVAPDDIENLLEALAFADELESKPLDLGAKLVEARHAGTFRAIPAGTLWVIRRQDEPEPVTAAQQQSRDQIVPTPALADLLNRLNRAQMDYDRAHQDLVGLREQLFADWYKYMLCVYPPETSRDSYPDPDEVLFFIRRKISHLNEQVARTGVYPPQDEGDTLAHRLQQAHTEVDDALAALNASAEKARTAYALQQVAAPQYYLPGEPVVLLAGAAATPSARHGQDGAFHPQGLLACATLNNGTADLSTSDGIRVLREQVAEIIESLPEPNPAVRTWEHTPWNPVLLQWEVEFFPVSLGNNLDPGDRGYWQDYITGNYVLPAQEVELRLRPGRDIPDKAANVYSGTTILSPAARPVLSARVLRYLEGHVLSAYNDAATQQGRPAVAAETFRAAPSAVLDWYHSTGEDQRLTTLIDIYLHLAAKEQGNLAQTLGGFNDALLMRKLTRQLPIADPLGFPGYKDFAEQEVAPAVGGESRHAPQPLSDFNPIRAGALRVRRLRMVDNFGLTHDVDVSRIKTTTQLRVSEHPEWVALPPRLAQPARLSLRWLDAEHDIEQMNSLPASSPVCGWIIPNNFDDSLAVYSADGRTLGALYALADVGRADRAEWRPAPGGTVTAVEEIGNRHLRIVIECLRDSGAAAVGELLGMLDDAVAAIEPEDSAHHRSQAVLMGRPIAVVRAEVILELMGRPAVHQDWNIFREDLRRSSRETNGFPRVRFPIRIGEHHQLNDGVLGYWLEDSANRLEPVFHAVQGVSTPGTESPLRQAIDGPPQYITMLVDPRGAVHATCGILPTKAIRIPPEHYRAALERMEVGFFTAPVLSDADRLALPLPHEPGYFWSWRERGPAGWVEVSTTATIRRSVVMAELGDGLAVWSALVELGWLTPVDDETALVTPAEQRAPLTPRLEPLREDIVTLLASREVDVPRLDAGFPDNLAIREGWLTLRPVPAPQREQGTL